jgi:hypothetical protein
MAWCQGNAKLCCCTAASLCPICSTVITCACLLQEGLSDLSGAGHPADDEDNVAGARLRWSSVNITRKILAYITEELYAGTASCH